MDDSPEGPKWLSQATRVFAVGLTVILPTVAVLFSAGVMHAREFLQALIEGNTSQVAAFGLALIGSTAVTHAVELCRLRGHIERLERLAEALAKSLETRHDAEPKQRESDNPQQGVSKKCSAPKDTRTLSTTPRVPTKKSKIVQKISSKKH